MNNNQLTSLCGLRWCEITFALMLAIFSIGTAFGENGTNGTISGEVFIVTKGADNVRLGLVEILVYPENVIQKHIEERKAHITDEMPDFDKDIKSLDETIAKSKESVEKLKALSDQRFELNLKSGNESSGLIDRAEDRRSIESSEQILALLESSRKQALEAKQNWPASRHYFKNLPETKNKTRTNSDGKFSLVIPKEGKFALVAHATRKTLETTEEYYWMVWVSLDGKDSKEIILGNHNLMSAGSEESIVSTKS